MLQKIALGCALGVIVPAVAFGAKRDQCRPKDFKDTQHFYGKVIQVYDGDTIKVKYGRKKLSIRMVGMDTLETYYKPRGAKEPFDQGYWAEEASRWMKDKLSPGDEVKIRLAREKCDVFHRVLGTVWKGRVNLNRELVKLGLAVPYCIYPNTYFCKAYAKLAEEAIEEELGIWGDEEAEIPYLWRRKVAKRKFTKPVGNLYTKEVYAPGNHDKIPVSDRIFFIHEDDVEDPYYFVD